MLNPGNKTGNGGEITEEESLRVDCSTSSWAFHRMVRCLSETEEQTHLILAVECILPQQCIAGFSTYLRRSNCFVLSSQPAASSSSFLHKGAPPLNKEAHFAMSQCVFWYSAAQDLAQTLSTRTLSWSKGPLMAGEGTKKATLAGVGLPG